MMDYYVYEHWNYDGCFYVGAGSVKNFRAYETNSRNRDWQEKAKNGFEVRIIKYFDNRKEAFDFEEKLTRKHFNENSPLVNKGLGTHLYGEANGMYGKGYVLKGRKKSQESIEKRSETIKKNKTLAGKKNPMYGISPRKRMKDEEKYNEWKKKIVRRGADHGRSAKIKITNLETNEIRIFDTITQAVLEMKDLNIPGSSISGGTRNGKIMYRNNFKLERI